jgi:hypothetical protein
MQGPVWTEMSVSLRPRGYYTLLVILVENELYQDNCSLCGNKI